MPLFPSVIESISDLTLEQVDSLLVKAKEFKNFSVQNNYYPHFTSLPFSHKKYSLITLATFFLENSTRTKLSFEIAAKNLGIRVINFSAESSSLKKGEGLEQTLTNLAHLGINICVYRTPHSHEIHTYKQNSPLKIINAGDGYHQHPTQALLDLFTMQEHQLPLQGKTIGIIGDCLHSRVCHSLMELLPQYGMKIILCGPKYFVPADLINFNSLNDNDNDNDNKTQLIRINHHLDETISQCDYLYLLRVQNERHQENSLFPQEMSQDKNQNQNQYQAQFGVSLKKLNKLNKLIPVFHAGPANIGVEIDQELISSPLYMGYEQIKHSVYTRMSVIDFLINNCFLEADLKHEFCQFTDKV